jgi:ankyrin repeat protein
MNEENVFDEKKKSSFFENVMKGKNNVIEDIENYKLNINELFDPKLKRTLLHWASFYGNLERFFTFKIKKLSNIISIKVQY